MIIKCNFDNKTFNSFQELLDFLKERWDIKLEFDCDIMIALKGKQNSIGEILALLDENKASIDYEIL